MLRLYSTLFTKRVNLIFAASSHLYESIKPRYNVHKVVAMEATTLNCAGNSFCPSFILTVLDLVFLSRK